MPYDIVRDIRITGNQAFNLTGNDEVVIKVKGEQVFKYKVPDGRDGVLTISLDGLLTDTEDSI